MKWVKERPTAEGMYWFTGYNQKTGEYCEAPKTHVELALVEIKEVSQYTGGYALECKCVLIKNGKIKTLLLDVERLLEWWHGKWAKFIDPRSN